MVITKMIQLMKDVEFRILQCLLRGRADTELEDIHLAHETAMSWIILRFLQHNFYNCHSDASVYGISSNVPLSPMYL